MIWDEEEFSPTITSPEEEDRNKWNEMTFA